MESVSVWLVQGGLERYIDNFAGVSVEQFKKLLMQDYGKFSVNSVEDKQKLFRLIKRINKTEPAGVLQAHVDEANKALGQLELKEARLDGNAAMIDLDDDFGDDARAGEGLLDLSPVHNRPRTAPTGGHPPPPNVGDDLLKIKVVVRKRPMNTKERERGEEDIAEVEMRTATLAVDEPKVKVDLTRYTERHFFAFDETLDENVTNDEVYDKTVRPLVETIFHHGKATCFAYGQTGSGKTYTMQPLPIMASRDILRIKQRPEYRDCDLWVSFFEIYGGKVFDLLNGRQRLVMREDGKKNVNVVGLQEHCVDDVSLVSQLIEHGNAARSTGSTGANDTSSRSHAIMQFSLKKRKADGAPGGKLLGKLSFIDLAGSERGADTYDNDKQTRIEGAEINKSLLALKECIRALDNDARHIPFRGSKLTEVLRDSFIGDQARTVMIANISPSSCSCEHTLNTLRYADRVKELRKDKNERAPSQVTPGANNPKVPGQIVRDPSPLPQRAPGVDPRHQAFVPRGPSNAGANPSGAGGAGSASTSEQASRNPSAPRARPITPRENVGPAGPKPAAPGIPAAPRALKPAVAPLKPSYGQPNRPPAAAAPPGKQRSVPVSELDSSPADSGGDPYQNGGSGDDGTDGDASDWDPAGGRRAGGGGAEGSAGGATESLLEEEDNLIALHRRHIEETMEAVRKEMQLLAEVDQPGSAIDSYVDRLARILEFKSRGLIELQERLVSFKARLIREERLAKMNLVGVNGGQAAAFKAMR